jgi:uncharacterized protein (TIGR02246 family)
MVIAAMLLAAPIAAAPATDPRAAVEAALADSAAGWNAGDLDRFVAIYASDATFVTPTGLLQGRAAIADHYRKSFHGGTNTRGRLGFRLLGVRTLSAVHLLVFARYKLDGATPEEGPTTLLFERRREGWRIVADHSS